MKLSTKYRHRTGVSTFAIRTSPSTNQCLQKSFHLSYADKIELKKISSPSENKKYAFAQTDTTKTVKLNKDNGLQTRWARTPAGNMRLASCGVKCLNSSLVFQINFSAGLTVCALKSRTNAKRKTVSGHAWTTMLTRIFVLKTYRQNRQHHYDKIFL